MAVEIKEIVIKGILPNEGNSKTSEASDSPGHEALIQECVAQVLKVLQKQNRR